MNELAKELQAPFDAWDIEWRPQGWGKKDDNYWVRVLAYVTNRAIQNRLDEVVGPTCWKNEFQDWHAGSQLCGISIFCDDGAQWITKWDGAEQTQIEAIKGGLSDAMKRAAVQWGIGRYLYRLDSTFARETSAVRKSKEDGWKYLSADGEQGKGCATGERHTFYWLPPELPKWALPKGKGNEGATDHNSDAKPAASKTDAKPTYDFPQIYDSPEMQRKAELKEVEVERAKMLLRDDLQGTLALCSSMDELQRVWKTMSGSERVLIGAEYIRDLKARLEVPA